MPTIGLPELVIIGFILVLVFGASRLPALGEGAGRAAHKLLRAIKNDAHIEVTPAQDPSISDAELVDPAQADDAKTPPKS